MRSLILVLSLFTATFAMNAAVAADGHNHGAAAKSATTADITVAELKAAIDAKTVTVIDVNGSKSFAAGHIPSALDYVAIKKDFAKSLPADKSALIVAYCGNEHCGAYKQAYNAAVALGYTNVKHLSVGLAGWKAAKMATEPAAATN